MRTVARPPLVALLALGTMLASPASAVAATSGPAVVRGNVWFLKDELSSGYADRTFAYGLPGDLPLFGDWDGDGDETPGVFRDGVFYLSDVYGDPGTPHVVRLGRPSDVPIAGDWDGDGVDGVGVVRGNTWYLDPDRDGGAAEIAFSYGRATDTPLAGDWDGDGVATAGVMRGNEWFLDNAMPSDGTADIHFAFGLATDRPIVGRWQEGATRDHPGVVRGNTWYLRYELSTGAADASFAYGRASDRTLTWGQDTNGQAAPDAPLRLVAFTVGAEGNPRGDLDVFASIAREALNDGRGWSLDHEVRFVLSDDTARADLHLWLTDDDNVGEKAPVCADEFSCTVGDDVYINDQNFNNATATWDQRGLHAYRQYVINHEAGHWIGLDHINECPDPGHDAPVMMQQSKFLLGCQTNLWPLPFEKERARALLLD